MLLWPGVVELSLSPERRGVEGKGEAFAALDIPEHSGGKGLRQPPPPTHPGAATFSKKRQHVLALGEEQRSWWIWKHSAGEENVNWGIFSSVSKSVYLPG